MFIVALFIGFWLFADAAKLPTIFHKCARTDPHFQHCLQLAIEDAFHKLAAGYPKLGLTPLEPLVIPVLDIGRGNVPLNINMTFRNVEIGGITTINITKQATDIDAYKSEYHTFNKKLILEGDYEVDGKILLIPIRGKGKAHIELQNVKGVLKLKGNKKARGRHTYFDLEKFDYKFSPSNMVIKFDTFNSDKKLNNVMNRILNKYWREVLWEVKPGFEESISEVFKNIASNLFNRVPLEEIYPEKIIN
ncbi:protein takeout-like [Cimex lectularius]|uniref:Takeout n=1 Tax=Cimex lectularius TaxID=79782 RepID=A0A8I6RM77_CIMLE|nr:protein takeout-like [Cimex lectularius]